MLYSERIDLQFVYHFVDSVKRSGLQIIHIYTIKKIIFEKIMGIEPLVP